jgi:tetraacyldisaccharide 4'-kinase
MSVRMSAGLCGRIRNLQRYWYSRNALTIGLLPLSWAFRALAVLRRWFYRLRNRVWRRLPVPVIVVGNISVGGTGKTPLVIWLAALLKANGFKPGIISRGYGGSRSIWPQLVTGNSDPDLVGDEPVLIARHTGCPTAVAPRRNQAARALLNEYDCHVLISDDGLQHYSLIRDIEIAVVDAQTGLGNGWCLPAGPLREPLWRLREVDFVVIHGTSKGAQYAMALHGDRVVNLRDRGISRSLDSFRHVPVHAVAGIGNPARFFDMLKMRGLEVHVHAFPDHHRFQAVDIEFGDARPVLMTEKDAIKCRAFAEPHYWYLPVSAALDEHLAKQVLNLLRSRWPTLSGMEKRAMETN